MTGFLKGLVAVTVGSGTVLLYRQYGIKSVKCEENDQRENNIADTRTRKPRKLNVRTLESAISQAEQILNGLKAEVGSPGLSVSVSIDGTPVWKKGYGFSDIENQVPCKADTVMRIASISKPLAMLAAARLMEEGKLDLDKPVQEYVQDFPEKEWKGEKVTLTTRMLVSHLGGIRHYEKKGKNGNKDEFQFDEYYIKEKYDDVCKTLDLFKHDPLLKKPGEEFLYTTHGYGLLSAVIQKAAGKKFELQMKQIFKDLDLVNTYLDENEPLIYNRARYYVKNNKGRLVNAPYVDNSWKWAGGGFVSTVEDLVKFGNAMLYAYQYQGSGRVETEGRGNTAASIPHSQNPPGYIKPDTILTLWTPVPKTKCSWDADGYYGMGWAVVPYMQKHGGCREQRFYVSHTGGAVGASSALVVLPRRCVDLSQNLPQGVTVAILANLQSVGMGKTALKIAKLFDEVDLS
ncbi:serine beta-lactamase-like protein LACTB, mitochondrial [Lingula anatina]|uniref:Serine beta-lactamase-like protein LACTB, mitochondrial n=1 Tax=Lingula anatina TaxID=7574 RepID=A0A1S3I4B1_LINAN|nr:serine beta-lactamase-like protein LACTB, mitochondrial [Lingula anatina]|eukprot:XP_013393068.1 serine beta-lactamase-like protein LACTB, mitochondrial [Lingula anatina]